MVQPGSYDKLLARLEDHLDVLSTENGTSLDEGLLSIATLQLLPTTPETVFPRQARQFLIIKIYTTLPHVENPTALIRLLKQLLDPVPLSALFHIEPPVDFGAGLDLNATNYHDLTLSLLEKADQKSVERLATLDRDVYEALVELWLCVPKEGTAAKAGSILANHVEIGGEPILKRIFRDKDIYELMLAICSVNSKKSSSLSKSQKSIAQARLMSWIATVATFNWAVIADSHHPEIESQYGLRSGEGLLDFAALKMVEYEDDILMHQTLIGFYWKLILSQRNHIDAKGNSRAIEYLISRKIHARMMKIYASSNDASQPIDISYVQTDVSVYISSFVSLHTQLFLSDTKTRDAVLKIITDGLSSLRPVQWTDEPPEVSRSLEVLRSLPRQALLNSCSPILLIPTKFPSSSALTTLAILFHGPPAPSASPKTPGEILAGPTPLPSDDPAEISAAKSLLQLYESHNSNVWRNIMEHASNFATTDVAAAANNFLRLIITARWDPVGYIMQNAAARSEILQYLVQIPEVPVAVLRSETREILLQRYDVARLMLEAVQKRGPGGDVAVWDELRRRVQGRVLHASRGGNIATIGS
jgi:hypothetical protein